MDRIELGIPVKVVQKSKVDEDRVGYEALPYDNLVLSSLKFVSDNINVIDMVIIFLFLMFNFLPTMMGYTYFIDSDEIIDDDARVTNYQVDSLCKSSGLKVALAVSVVSSSILLLNNWELWSSSNQTNTNTQTDDFDDLNSSI